jgi:hypothetical protein
MALSSPPSALDEAVRRIRQLVAEGELEPAVEQLRELAREAPQQLADEVIVLSGRLARLNKQVRSGTLADTDADAQRTRIALAIPNVLEEVSRKLAPAAAPVTPPVAPAEVFAGTEAVAFEAIHGVNNLKQVAWLEQG